MAKVRVAVSILGLGDRWSIYQDVLANVEHKVDAIHCDVMEREFVGNTSPMDPDFLLGMSQVTFRALDVHLMV